MKITCITNNGEGLSEFSSDEIELSGNELRQLSQQIPALNFRLRKSSVDYKSDWHVAGDPTLLVVLTGTIRIELRSGVSKNFSAGELFIARDYLPKGAQFNQQVHGHKAVTVGNNEFSALHLKLSRQTR